MAPTATPSVVQPPTKFVGAIYMSDKDGGSKVDTFPNTTSVVWAVVNLQYSPDGPLSVHISIRDKAGKAVFDGDFSFPKSGQQSYLIVPASKFTPDSTYKTTLQASGKTFAVDWNLTGDTKIDNGGGDDSSTSGGS